jgi:biofilm PGA synthesis protein PgaD
MKPLQLIINRPHLVPGPRRVFYGMVTFFFWYLWLNLWLPVVTFIAWLFGGFLGYRQVLELRDYHELMHLLAWYALVIVILGGGLLAWATYNLMRFRGKERRGPLPDVTLEEYAKYMRVAPHELAAWRRAGTVTVHHDESGHFESVDIALPPVPRSLTGTDRTSR